MGRLDDIRRFYARLVTTNAGVADARIVDAFATVERERFLGPGPWPVTVANGYISTDTDDPAVLYQDIVVGLLPHKGINNGKPTLHAKCIAAAAPQPGETVLHVGAGSGYYTAILASLVGEHGRLDAFEIEPDLARRAAENLPAHCSVHGHSAIDGPLPQANVIYVSAGATRIPSAWLNALTPDGRLVFPLTPVGELGCMLLVSRGNEFSFKARVISPAAFVRCVGATDEGESHRLSAAIERRSPDSVRSLRCGTAPDDSAWYVGDDWWLSTAALPER